MHCKHKNAIMTRLFFITSYFLMTLGTTRGQVQSNEYRLDTILQKCLNKKPSNIGMIECLQSVEKGWNKELNKYYKLLLTKLDTTEQTLLRESQRQWLIFKDKEVKFFIEVFSKKDGSMWPLMISDKSMQIIRQRAIELSDYYETLTQN